MSVEIQVPALTCLFHLLDVFVPSHNNFAPVVYKTLIFLLIEHTGADAVRDFIVANMSAWFERVF